MTPPPADVRVYLFTYRRSHLLPRALESLLAQTHQNWVCELHNDDPADAVPAELVAGIADPRIRYVPHATNLGPTATFNLAFTSIAEPFISILEDDNWWEPGLLARLLAAMTDHRDAAVTWSNMWLWQEEPDGAWTRQDTIWPVTGGPVTVFRERQPRQVCGALHSNGAMLVRSDRAAAYVVPESVPFMAMESVRDRLFPLPMVLVHEPLANFAITCQSWRTETADENMQLLVVLAQTFLETSNRSTVFYQQVWRACAGARGHTHRALLVASALSGRLTQVLISARLADLLVAAGWALRYPARFARLFSARARFPELYALLRTP